MSPSWLGQVLHGCSESIRGGPERSRRDVGGVHVQSQTNALTKGLSTNWVTIPGTDLSNSYTTPLVKSNQAVFYRLINP